MLKVVVVDDEQMICSLISQILDWEKLDAEIVGMAYTGIDAFNLILEKKPDIIISDIRMPGYDGLELIKRTKEAGVEAEFVMISGFKQFEYAQNAMKYGVKYYLLKPIEEEKLSEIVQEIRSNILSKRAHAVYEDQMERELRETKGKMKKRFLTSILSHQEEGLDDVDRNVVNEEYSTSFKEGVFQAVYIKLDTEDVGEDCEESVILEIEKHMALLGEICEEYIATNLHSGIIVLLNYKLENEKLLYQKIEELYDGVKKYIEQFKEFSLVIGVGEKIDNFFQARFCLKTAADAIKYRIRLHDKRIIYAEEYQFKPYDIETIVTMAKKQTFLTKVESGNCAEAEEYVASAIREVRYREEYSPVLPFDVLIAYVDTFTEYCKKQNFYDHYYMEIFKKWNLCVDNTRSEKILIDETKNLIRSMMEYIAKSKRERDIKPIRIVKQYIEQNYMEEISLAQLAELVDMNASYLSSVFKKETGMTYSEYLVHCRVEKACRLLVETNMNIAEIAGKSGYQDARYFSKQFLKQVGLKPSEYRKLYS